MASLRSRALLLALCLPWAAACGDDSTTGGAPSTGGSGAGGAGGGAGPMGGFGGGEPSCDAHASAGLPSFEDTTAAWGLSAVAGGRVMSGDVNGDGYPDLIVHGFAPNVRETIGTPPKRVFLLINEEAANGGRNFVDRTYESGLWVPADGSTTELKSSQLAVLGDVDNDGDLDVFSGTYSDLPAASPPTPADLDRSEIYLNDGTGHFTRRDASGVAFSTARRTSSATFADVDRDGLLDLFVGVHYSANGALQAPALFKGGGDGSFTDISTASGVTKEKRATFGATSCDLDGDGNPELLMSAYARGPNVLFHRLGDGTYEDLGESSTYAFDDDQNYHDNQNFLCWCTLHDTDPDCAGVDSPSIACPNPADSYWASSEEKPNRLGGNTFSTACGDIDGDGKLDLYTAEIAHWWAGESSDKSDALLNTSTGPGVFSFERQDRAAAGLEIPHVGVDWNEGGIVSALADLDGDGRTDILLGASDYPDQYLWVLHQKPDGTFEEIGDTVGMHHPCGVGVTVADFDRDGDLDVVVASGTARDCAQIWSTNEVHFYENGGESSAHTLAVRLRGAGGSNAAAIGARVKISAGRVEQVKELTSGYGHFGLQNDTALVFGVGACDVVDTIEVVWPDAARTTETFANVPAHGLIELHQGDSQVVEVLP
ncbi:MAG: CRTAC1 family protein [Polyangiaceae bacterium]